MKLGMSCLKEEVAIPALARFMRFGAIRSHAAVAALALWLAAAPAAAQDLRLFRPLTADPRECQSRWRMSHGTEDWRYGTDVTDSTSQGGVVKDREKLNWEAAAAQVFLWKPLERVGTWRGPWVRYQVGIPAGVFSRFDGAGVLVNTDYQWGGSVDVLWTGAFDRERGITDYRQPVVTSRLTLMHHSSHLGDEYFSQGSFGRNQTDPPYQGAQLGHPPVKRVDLTFEDVRFTLSIEGASEDGRSTLRLYGGGDMKLVLPKKWKVGGVTPEKFRSPVFRSGIELRSSGQSERPTNDIPARLLNQFVRSPMFDSEWIVAADFRWAKPFNFASADNPTGDTEVWTPHLWTAAPYGREYEHYAGSWRGMVGAAIRPRVTATGPGSASARPIGPEWIVALEWYRGYAPDGQLLDQRLRYRPRQFFWPSITAHF